MALASLFRLPKFNRASVTKTTSRQPIRTRPCLEMLEDRMLLTAGTANQFGYQNNPSVNFNTQAIGQTVAPIGLPPTQGNPVATAQPFNVLNSTQQTALLSGLANQLAQGQAYGQFRALAVNSQGQAGNDFVGLQQMYLMTAMGFGSGTWPNRPWVPAAYNLGLANHQFGFASQSDLGFSQAPPWGYGQYRQFTSNEPLNEDATWMPEHALIEKSLKDQPSQQIPDNADEIEEKTIPLKLEQPKQSEQDKPELKRGDPATEEALFTDVRVNHRAPTDDTASHGKKLFEAGEGKDQMPLADSTGIPSSLWLSAVAPAQMAAMVAGLPGVEAPSQAAEVAIPAGVAE